MTLNEKHIKLVEAVNNSLTKEQHYYNDIYLHAWRQGVEDSGGRISLIDADMFYLNQGIDRPMCGGFWLDWEAVK